MQRTKSTAKATLILGMIFLTGVCSSLFVVIDAEYTHLLINQGQNDTDDDNNLDTKRIPFIEESRKGILLVISKGCDGKTCSTGTGFIVKPGYVATNAHVIECGARCEDIVLKDHKGMMHEARIEGIATNTGKLEDLAILKISNSSIAPLKIGDSSIYEVHHDGEEVITIGFPLLGYASSEDKASVSDRGNISMFKKDDSVFVISGMHANAGNSGGPVFHIGTGDVIGIVVSGLRGRVHEKSAPVEGVDYVIPINRLKTFFAEKIGQDL